MTSEESTLTQLVRELKVELTSVLSCVDALACLTPSQGSEHLGEARACTERARDIADTLLLAAGHLPPRRAPADLNGIVTSAGPALASIAGPGITIELRLSPKPVPVHAHTGELERILVNLVLNASPTVAGRGILTIETALVSHPSCGGTALPRGRYARLTVTAADTGPALSAFPAEEAEEVKRLEPAPSTVSYSVDHLQGTVAFANEGGLGVSLNVFLPLIAAL